MGAVGRGRTGARIDLIVFVERSQQTREPARRERLGEPHAPTRAHRQLEGVRRCRCGRQCGRWSGSWSGSRRWARCGGCGGCRARVQVYRASRRQHLRARAPHRHGRERAQRHGWRGWQHLRAQTPLAGKPAAKRGRMQAVRCAVRRLRLTRRTPRRNMTRSRRTRAASNLKPRTPLRICCLCRVYLVGHRLLPKKKQSVHALCATR